MDDKQNSGSQSDIFFSPDATRENERSAGKKIRTNVFNERWRSDETTNERKRCHLSIANRSMMRKMTRELNDCCYCTGVTTRHEDPKRKKEKERKKRDFSLRLLRRFTWRKRRKEISSFRFFTIHQEKDPKDNKTPKSSFPIFISLHRPNPSIDVHRPIFLSTKFCSAIRLQNFSQSSLSRYQREHRSSCRRTLFHVGNH